MDHANRQTTYASAKWWALVLAVFAVTSCSSNRSRDHQSMNAPSNETPDGSVSATATAVAGDAGSVAHTGTAGLDAGKAGSPALPDSGGFRTDGAAGKSAQSPRDAAITTPRTHDAGDAAKREPRPIDGGYVSGPITGGNVPDAGSVDLSAYGYVEEEFFLEGDATTYVASGELGIDGVWKAVANGQSPYQTRLLVRRPANAQNFNGTVFVEWLNVTGGVDATVGFILAWEELLRGGYGYVGVSAQQVGVDSLKSADDPRYGTLNHPGDEYAYEIFAQAGAAIGWPGKVDLMRGLPVERLLAYGESQSAMRMITYVNTVHPMTGVFDGFIIHSRAGWGAPIGTESDGFLGNGQPVRVRTDIHDARVLQFFTESELFLSLGPAYDARQPDSDYLRTWEVAGAAHADQHMLGGTADIGCGTLNDGPQHFVLKAAVREMHQWIKDGAPPPKGHPLEVVASNDAIARDEHGNALGGIRTPAVDVPIATISGDASSGNAWNPVCQLMGQTIPFTPQELLALYPTHQDYVDQVIESAHRTRKAGFILPEEETTIVATANSAPIPK